MRNRDTVNRIERDVNPPRKHTHTHTYISCAELNVENRNPSELFFLLSSAPSVFYYVFFLLVLQSVITNVTRPHDHKPIQIVFHSNSYVSNTLFHEHQKYHIYIVAYTSYISKYISILGSKIFQPSAQAKRYVPFILGEARHR